MEATISAMLEACESPLALKFLFRRGGVPAIRNSLSALASPDKPGISESGRLSAQSKVPVCSKRLPKLSRTTIAGFKTSLISSFVTGVAIPEVRNCRNYASDVVEKAFSVDQPVGGWG